MTQSRTQFRQGDLLFIRQGARPDDDTLQPRAGAVLVEGETTGHAHRLAAPTRGAILTGPDGALYVDITHTTQVVHEEHGPITLDPGLWLVVRQREYVAPDISRVVAD